MPLSDADVSFYRETGYCIYRHPLFRPERFARLTAIFEEHLANKGEKRGDELDVPHLQDRRLLEFLLADEVLDLVEPLIGPNIALWSSHFISKEPCDGRATPWHEDSAYWDGLLNRMDQIVTIWLAIDASDKENGCMKVIPGTHHNGFSEYVNVDRSDHTFGRQIKPEQVDEDNAVYFELQPNECSLHDGRIIHGADANLSPRRRCGYTMRYFSQTTVFFAEHHPSHKIWHCRGENIANNPVASLPV